MIVLDDLLTNFTFAYFSLRWAVNLSNVTVYSVFLCHYILTPSCNDITTSFSNFQQQIDLPLTTSPENQSATVFVLSYKPSRNINIHNFQDFIIVFPTIFLRILGKSSTSFELLAHLTPKYAKCFM